MTEIKRNLKYLQVPLKYLRNTITELYLYICYICEKLEYRQPSCNRLSEFVPSVFSYFCMRSELPVK
jgi:hypothetical protein